MGRKGWTIFIVMFVGATIGAGIGYLVGQSVLAAVLGAVVGAVIGAVGFGLSVFIPVEVWLALAEFGQIAECCLSFFVFSLASMVTLGGLLLWHSFALAALTGIGVMTVLLVVLSVGVRLYEAQ